MASVPMPAPAPQPKQGKRAGRRQPATIAGLLDNLFSQAGSRPGRRGAAAPVRTGNEAKPKQPVRAVAAHVAPHPKLAKSAPPKAAPHKPHRPRPWRMPCRNRHRSRRSSRPTAEAEVRTAYSASPPPAGTLPGAQPTVPAGSFDARWSAFR